MRLAIDAGIAVEYIDLNANERGIKTVYKRCQTTILAENEDAAKEQLKQAALPYFPGCWQLIIHRFDTLRLDD